MNILSASLLLASSPSVTRNFSLYYILLDSLFVVFFVVLLFVTRRRVTAYFALTGGALYFLVDFLLFYLATKSRSIWSYPLNDPSARILLDAAGTGGVLFWMSMSYGILDFAFIWLWLSQDKRAWEFTLLIVCWWIACPLITSIGNNLDPDVLAFQTARTTGAYHGIMGVFLFVGYAIAIVYNLVQKDESKKAPLLRLFLIGFFAQFLWEFCLLISGIRSNGLSLQESLSVLLVDSLVETNLGMPYLFFIHRAVTKKYDELGHKKA